MVDKDKKGVLICRSDNASGNVSVNQKDYESFKAMTVFKELWISLQSGFEEPWVRVDRTVPCAVVEQSRLLTGEDDTKYYLVDLSKFGDVEDYDDEVQPPTPNHKLDLDTLHLESPNPTLNVMKRHSSRHRQYRIVIQAGEHWVEEV